MNQIPPLPVTIKQLTNAKGLSLPAYATDMAAGMDLMAAPSSSIRLRAGKWEIIPTGIAIALPQGFEAQIRPRSGLVAEDGLTVLNAPGTIDADYRGEIKVILYNAGDQMQLVSRGMRIAQMVVAPVARVGWAQGDLGKTARSSGGFGSTGA